MTRPFNCDHPAQCDPPPLQPPTPSAGASIVIPIRLQVTGPTLAAIETYRQFLIKQLFEEILPLPDTQHMTHHSGLNTDPITIHRVTIDFDGSAIDTDLATYLKEPPTS